MKYGNKSYGILFPSACKICGTTFRNLNSLRVHFHNNSCIQVVDYTTYMKKEYGVDVAARKSKATRGIIFPIVCNLCGKDIKHLPGLASHLKAKHEGHDYHLYVQSVFGIRVMPKTEELMICLVCQKSFLNLAQHLKKKHGISKEEYEQKHGQCDFQSPLVKERVTKGVRLHSKSVKGLSPRDRLKKTLGKEDGEKAYQRWRNSMDNVFSMDWFVRKYGKEDGEIRYRQRQESISEMAKRNPHLPSKNKNNWSLVSQELFWKLYDSMPVKDGIYFGELNHEYGCGTNRNFDFVSVGLKRVIEFNGESFHPRFPVPHTWRQVYTKKTASQVADEDKRKIEAAERNGFTVKVVWNKDFKKTPNSVFNDCMVFLKESPNEVSVAPANSPV